MDTLLWIVLFSAISISLVPVIRLSQDISFDRYRPLLYQSIAVFAWGLLLGLGLVLETPILIYYIHLSIYPLVVFVVGLFYQTIQSFIRRKTKPLSIYLFFAYFFIFTLICWTNTWHQLVLNVSYESNISRETMMNAEVGVAFYINALFAYIILLVGFARLIRHLLITQHDTHEFLPFRLVLGSILIGIPLNFVHIFVYTLRLDPTYIFIVLVTYALYYIIHDRDFHLALINSSRDNLLEKMREMYIITDNYDCIVEYSARLTEMFGIESEYREELGSFIERLRRKSIIYTNIESVIGDDLEDTTYLYLRVTPFSIPKFANGGNLILLYDETRLVKMIHEIRYIKSFDLMTDIYNRNFFEEQRKKLESAYPRFGVVLFDIDGLKIHNDYLGHKQGDNLLIRFATALKSLLETYDDLLCIRMGGDEFLVIAQDATQDKLESIVKKISSLTNNQEDMLKHISFSYGIAIRQDAEETFETVLGIADRRLYEGKNKGKAYKDKLLQALKDKGYDRPYKSKRR